MRNAKTRLLPAVAAVAVAVLLSGPVAPLLGEQAKPAARPAAAPYYPGPGDDWQRRTPEDVGMSSRALDDLETWVKANETDQPIDLRLGMLLSAEPYNEVTGPTKDRGTPNGLVLRHGYIVKEIGDTKRVDMTFSATKTYLSTTAGLAVDRGLIRSVNDRVAEYVHDGGFDSPHNAKITWHQLLNQTSEWEGTIWGKPDWADRPTDENEKRVLVEPGTRWKYNDARVNRLALSLLRVWRRPLPQVLREYVMDPIDASTTWEWHGYDDSWVTIDGQRMQSVAGGAHWGGGMWISSRDHARFGYMFLRGGKWRDRQLISPKWITMASTPTPQQPTYGYMNWFLNTNRKLWPSAPERSFAFIGGNVNMVWVSPEHDLVVVIRWIKNGDQDEFLKRVMAAIKDTERSSR